MKKYENPQIEYVLARPEDVITSSNDGLSISEFSIENEVKHIW